MRQIKQGENERTKLFSEVVLQMPLIVFALDKDWRFIVSEGKALGSLGLSKDEVLGLSAKEMYKDYPDIIQYIERSFQGETLSYVIQLNKACFETYLAPFYNQRQEIEGVIGASIDISKRIQKEKELKTSYQYQQALIKSAPGILYLYNDQGELIYWNKNHESLTGYSAEELEHFQMENWYVGDEESLKAVQLGLKEAREKGFGEAEARLRCKDERRLPMYLTASLLMMDQKPYFVGMGIDLSSLKKAEAELLELNQTLELKVSNRTKELKVMNEKLNLANEEYYAMNQELMSTNDLLVEMQDYLVESEKMAALGSLVAGVAHEVNTPIGVGMTASSYLSELMQEIESLTKKESWDKEEMLSFFEDIKKASDIIFKNLSRAATLVKSFKQLSIDQSSEPKRVFEIGAYIDEILISLSPSIKKTKIHISHHCSQKIMMEGYPGSIAQIITNLVMNSLKHGFAENNTGEITITTNKVNTMVEIIYEDNGKGMEKEVLAKIFEPFFTTNRGSGGSGLGLAIVYNIVTQQFKGNISCTSSLGQGTRFAIKLKEEV